MFAWNTWLQGIDFGWIIQWMMFAAAALLSISVHESSHALAAWRLGDDTAKRMGRISLNPLRHLEPVGFVMMVVAQFGWARPVPVNMYRFKNPKVGMAITSAAGPASNLLLALLAGIGFYLSLFSGGQVLWAMWEGYVRPSGWHYYLTLFLYICLLLNAGLAVFNLIPVSPLDGSKILAIILPDNAYRWLMRYERYGFAVLALLLFTGVMEGPLELLRGAVLDAVEAIARPLAGLITGVEL